MTPLTIARVDRALDRLAEIIDRRGDAGRVFLPVYMRLERDRRAMAEESETLAAVRERARRSRDRTATRSS